MRISDWSSDVCSADLHHRRGDAEVARVFALGLRPLVELVAAVRIVAGQQFPAAGNQRVEPLQALQRLRVAGLGALAGPGRVVDVFEIRALHRRSEEHTSELQSLMRISYADFCLTKQIYSTP